MPSELFEDASVHAIMDATVAAFRGPRALQRCYWWVVIRCWLWVVIASLLAISSAGIGLSSRGKKWPLAPTPAAMSDTIGFTTRDGVERISNIWPWPWSPTRRPAAEDRHALSLLDTSVLPPPPPPPPRAACLPCNCSNTSVIERMAARLEQQERTIAELKAQLSSVSRPAQLRERATERQGREGGPIPPADTASSEGAVGAEARSSS